MTRRSMLQRVGAWRPELSVESVALLVSLYLALCFNAAFWHAVFDGRELGTLATWRFAAGTFIAMCALHFALFLCVVARWNIKFLMSLVLITTAMAAHYMDRYTVFMDAQMLGNILHTEYPEARELLTTGLLLHVLLLSGPPIVGLWRLRVRDRPWMRAIGVRLLSLAAAVAVAAGGLLLAYRELSTLMRTHKEVRYLVTPGNYLYSALRVLLADVHQARRPLIALGTDARVDGRPPGAKPRLLVIFVGETARAPNWGLNGYARDTTPQLRALGVFNFSNVQSCGTATEVSLPCMFAAIGRRDYDEDRIRGSQSLLHVLDHAGVRTLWRDNQTGCKGVCAGLPFQQWNRATVPGLCANGACYDEVLLHDLQKDIDATHGDLVIVLHPLGNHGPSYDARYPDRFRQFTPVCRSAELNRCTSEQIVNSYDNAILYADHVVAETIRLLQRQTDRDAALVYVSDHGESLGEHGLYLHGIPYSIAPAEQTAVPMIAWLTQDLANGAGIDGACLRAKHAAPLSHDNLFHSVLGLLDVRTAVYEPSLDVFRSCRSAEDVAGTDHADGRATPDKGDASEPHISEAHPITQPNDSAHPANTSDG